MKYSLNSFKEFIPSLSWDASILADKLSIIGHEAEAIGDTLEITLTSNRKDCAKLEYLVFDLAGIYQLKLAQNLFYKPGIKVDVTLEFVNKLLGSDLSFEQYKALERLGFIVEENFATAPDFRTDIRTSADIAEEVFRIYGTKNIDISPLKLETKKESAEYDRIIRIKALLAADGVDENIGFTETQTYTFTKCGKIELKNPFSKDEPYLRDSLVYGLLKTLAKNPSIKRGYYFEIGNVFLPDESTYLGIIVTSIKDATEISKQLSKRLDTSIELKSVNQSLLDSYNVKQGKVFFYEVPITNIKITELPKTTIFPNIKRVFKKISKYPPLIRDVTVKGSIVKYRGGVEEKLHKFINEFKDDSKYLFTDLIDYYKKPEEDFVYVTARFVMQNYDHSFTDNEIAVIDAKIEQYFFKPE